MVPNVGYGPSSTATVHVTVEDINEGPVFMPDPLIVTRMENVPVGSFVASLNATDPDILELQSIRYDGTSPQVDNIYSENKERSELCSVCI